ncbi:cytidylyltransferase domain-containing protein [Campylobacter coli]
MKFTAVIPVKANSSRLPGKNIKPFGNENLLTRKIRQVKASNIADRIIVSSDSDEMLQMARDMGVEAIKRPIEFADESRPFGEFLIYLTELIKEGHLAYTCATSPFFDENLMINAKKEYLKALENDYDSLIAIYKFKHYMLDEKRTIEL